MPSRYLPPGICAICGDVLERASSKSSDLSQDSKEEAQPTVGNIELNCSHV